MSYPGECPEWLKELDYKFKTLISFFNIRNDNENE